MPEGKNIFDLIAIATNRSMQTPKPELRSFTHVKSYHACRPRDVTTYFTQGVRLVPRAELEQEFRRIFAHLSERLLDEAIEKYGRSERRPEVYAALDHRFLTEHCGHYALYGSETIKGLAARLSELDGNNHMETLKTIGTPTVLVLEIPMEELSSNFIDQVDEHLQHLADGRHDLVYQIGTLIDCAPSLYKPIPPSWIVEHFTPHRLVDPEDRSQIYYYE